MQTVLRSGNAECRRCKRVRMLRHQKCQEEGCQLWFGKNGMYGKCENDCIVQAGHVAECVGRNDRQMLKKKRWQRLCKLKKADSGWERGRGMILAAAATDREGARWQQKIEFARFVLGNTGDKRCVSWICGR